MTRPAALGPAVSVIVPTYQRRELVRRAVASVFAQTFTDWELIVVDDGSTDGTQEALAAVHDHRLHYHWQPNRGVAAARNAALRLARGEIVAFLDSDDRWLPDHLAVLTGMLERNPQAVIASTCPRFVLGGRRRKSRERAHLLDIGTNLGALAGFPSCVAARRSALVAAGGFDDRLRAGEDTDLWLRLGTFGALVTASRSTVVRQRTIASLAGTAQRAGHYLEDAEHSAGNFVAAVERVPEPRHGRLAQQARSNLHLARAMIAVDRNDYRRAGEELRLACRQTASSPGMGAVDHRVRRHLTRWHEPAERLVALTALARLWPDQESDTAHLLRARAIVTALRCGEPAQAIRLAGAWSPRGSIAFGRRIGPYLYRRARRSWQDRRNRARQPEGETPAPSIVLDPRSIETAGRP